MPAAAAKIANIGQKERQKRLVIGLVMLGASFALLAALVHLGAARPWRLALFVPLAGAGAGIFQAAEKT